MDGHEPSRLSRVEVRASKQRSILRHADIRSLGAEVGGFPRVFTAMLI